MRSSIFLFFIASVHLSCTPAVQILSLMDTSREDTLAKSISDDIHIASSTSQIAGGFISACLDEQDRYIIQANSPHTLERMERGIPLTIKDIKKLHEGGVNDDTIIAYIQGTRSSYNLSQQQIKILQDAGISQRLLNHIIDTGR